MRQRIPATLFMAVIGMVFQQAVPGATLAPSVLAIEQSYSTFTDQVFAAYGYALGLSGKGVAIALLDTGIAVAHSEFPCPGNNGGADPQCPARYAKEAWANNQLITVGAVDEKIASRHFQTGLVIRLPGISSRELMLKLNCQRPLGRAARLALVLSLGRHPNHLDDAATEKLLALRLVQLF